jgi:hypothetical protein
MVAGLLAAKNISQVHKVDLAQVHKVDLKQPNAQVHKVDLQTQVHIVDLLSIYRVGAGHLAAYCRLLRGPRP